MSIMALMLFLAARLAMSSTAGLSMGAIRTSWLRELISISFDGF